MAIREIKRKEHASYQVYWNDPEDGRRLSKTFYSLKEAEYFNKKCSLMIEKYRKTHSTKYKRIGIHKPRLPTTPDGLNDLKARCLEIYSDNRVRVADIFDYVMETLNIPVRFKDVSTTIKNREKGRPIPAKLRVTVLSRDGYRCKMCGASAENTALHVDHILPVSRGGITEERNLQTLCQRCNLGKSDLAL